MATVTKYFWWTDPNGASHSIYDVYAIHNWDGVTNPQDVQIIISPQNYSFIYDSAEDSASLTTFNNVNYYGHVWNYQSGSNLIVRITYGDHTNSLATIALKSDGTIQFYGGAGAIDGDNIYINIGASNDIFVSKLSNGTTTYTIKDANAYHIGDLATVATTGSYTDLTNKPTIDQTYDPTSTNAQSGTAVSEAVEAKVDKTTTGNRLYGTNSSGVQYLYTVATAATASTVAYRGSGGVLQVGTPTANAHATTKQYVDNLVSTDYALQIIDY